MDPRILFTLANFWVLWTVLSPPDGSIFSNTCHVLRYPDELLANDAFAIILGLFDLFVVFTEVGIIKL